MLIVTHWQYAIDDGEQFFDPGRGYLGRTRDPVVKVNLTGLSSYEDAHALRHALESHETMRLVPAGAPVRDAGPDAIARAFFGLDHAGEDVTRDKLEFVRAALDELWAQAGEHARAAYKERARRFLALLKVPT